MKSHLFGAMCAVLFTFTTQSATAAFFGRLPTTPGGMDFQAYYDDQLDITWTADATINGQDTWDNQVAWADGFTIDGIGGWRLPNMDINGDGMIVACQTSPGPPTPQSECLDNEYGHLFHYGDDTTLGSGVRPNTPFPFSNLPISVFWSGTEDASDSNNANVILFNSVGSQGVGVKELNHFAWAVHDGDVVPVPAAVWLFGSGLLGLARHKR